MFTEKVFVEDKKHGVENTVAYSRKIIKELRTMIDALLPLFEQEMDPELECEYRAYEHMLDIFLDHPDVDEEDDDTIILPERFVDWVNDDIRSYEDFVGRRMREYALCKEPKLKHKALWYRNRAKVMYSFLDDVCIGL